MRPTAQRLRRLAVDGDDLRQRRALAPARRLADLADDLVASPKIVPLDQLLADVDVVPPRDVARLRATDEARASGQDFEDSQGFGLTHVSNSNHQGERDRR